MRLDVYLAEKGYFDTRTKAKQAIERGEVYLNGKLVTKPSSEVEEFEKYVIERVCEEAFVSLGGFKLSKAIKDFDVNVSGLVATDIGASTGGFTDCLLQRGARRVFAVDLNDNLLHPKLKADERVVRIIKNAKDLSVSDFFESPDILTADLSFISATVVLPVFYELLSDGARIVLLIKPQFENEKRARYKNGIIRDKSVVKAACKKVYDAVVDCGFVPIGITSAPRHRDKNSEFLIYAKKESGKIPTFENLFDFCERNNKL